MSRPIVEVENLSKRYRLGQFTAQTMLEEVERFLARFRRQAGRGGENPSQSSDFWALKDVSFSVQPGEILGIIGRNGAGKSTLLKLLSRITEPTEGHARLRGRVASLLEVGTGFHPELTGRENIYLNGAILGMTRAEIRSQFDEIVAFAEVEKFLDTPVKRYSSGMYVRLAFAVAAHLEPEILVIDEVLAVGDAAFQAKCLGKMKDVSTHGRTLLFVSHNMNAIKQLTNRVVLLREGAVDFIGSAGEAIERNLSGTHRAGQRRFEVANAKRKYPGTGDARILTLRFERPLPHFDSGEPLRYVVSLRAERPIRRLRVGMTIYARDDTPVGTAFSPEIEGFDKGAEREIAVTLPFNRLAPGFYHCGVSIGSGNNQSTFLDYDIVLDTLSFEVAHPKTPNGTMASWAPTWGSIILPELAIEPLSEPELRKKGEASLSFASDRK
jgi:lipopolysaccharide transport system ATP-binding protein